MADDVETAKEAGNSCMAVGDFVNAMKWYSQALTVAPRDAALYSNRSFAFLKLGLPERALADADEAIRRRPDWAKAHFRRAEALSQAHVHTDALRTQRLVDVKDYNGFNVISGAYDPSKVRGIPPRPRYLSDRPSEELAKTGEITVRNSCYRFYTAAPSGNKHDYRQHQLVSEGQNKPKFSSVLGVGRAEEPSYGVEDQFAKSHYGGKVVTDFGLVEVREPGRYTPRKLGGSAAKPQMIFGATWRDEARG